VELLPSHLICFHNTFSSVQANTRRSACSNSLFLLLSVPS
jgi:hypothetical protein